MYSKIDKNYDKINLGLFTNKIYKNYFISFYRGILDGEYDFKRHFCFCNSALSLEIAKLDKFNLPSYMVSCKSCGLLYNSVRPTNVTNLTFYKDFYRFIYESRKMADEAEHAIITPEQIDNWNIKSKNQYDKFFTHIKQDEIPGNSVLDFGCNYGYSLIEYQRRGYQVTGYDYGQKNIESGRKALGLDLNFGGFENIINDGRKFDLVTIFHVMEHFIDFEDEVSKLKQILNEGAIIFIELPGFKKWKMDGNFKRNVGMVHTYCFTKDIFDRMFSSLGFERIYIDEEINAIYRYTGLRSEFRPDPIFHKEVVSILKDNNEKYPVKMNKLKSSLGAVRFWKEKELVVNALTKLDSL